MSRYCWRNEVAQEVRASESIDEGEGELELGRDVRDDGEDVDEGLDSSIETGEDARDHERRGEAQKRTYDRSSLGFIVPRQEANVLHTN